MLRRLISKLLMWIWDQLDTILALLFGLICSALGFIGIAQPTIITSAILGVLTILAFSLMRDRSEREKLRQHVSLLVERSEDPNLDLIFYQQIDESSMLQEAEKEVWIAQETGIYVIETKKALLMSFLRRGGLLRIVVAQPKEGIIRQLAFRNHDFSYSAIVNRAKAFDFHIRSVTSEVGEGSEKIQVRYSQHILGANYVITDPASSMMSKRRAAIRYPGFRFPLEERIGIMVQGEVSPKLFMHFYREVQQLFEYSSKIVLLVGASGSGKTALLKRMIRSAQTDDSSNLFFVFSTYNQASDKHSGYEVVTSNNSMPRPFAEIRNDGSYDIDISIWASVTNELTKAFNAKKVIVIDEIGPLQLRAPGFWDVIEKILNDPAMTLFAAMPLDDKNVPELQKVRLHYRSTVLRWPTQQREREDMEHNLFKEFQTSLFTVKNSITRLRKQ